VYSKKYSVKSGTQETGSFLPLGVSEFKMFHSFCFPVAFQLPGNGAGRKVRIRRIPIIEDTEGRHKIAES
jgi:hypothetical protein